MSQQKKESVVAAVRQDAWAFRFASAEMRGDKDVAKAAVEKDGRSLQYAEEKLQADKTIVMLAVTNYGMALQFASDELQGDRDIVETALKNDPEALKHASRQLKGDDKILKLKRELEKKAEDEDEEASPMQRRSQRNSSADDGRGMKLTKSGEYKCKSYTNAQQKSVQNTRVSRKGNKNTGGGEMTGGCFGAVATGADEEARQDRTGVVGVQPATLSCTSSIFYSWRSPYVGGLKLDRASHPPAHAHGAPGMR
eukprot:CAMPEP_0181201908 /NCGR_PEP_ID=MMETSP1096-20121128/18552_1 /TAXON_ID=156174 ORGANISM="Chrysochromulina ericina, Strain CCMP281" /NCGR_SAMPLE_ID=MMETSP1096 /ASSEMBLY_ACC=CAM_ASM_000453 /LENGTH=252 /DNA_ID=CAMNT_0023292371 /DNA_START=37 /DNA_END=794 /DNA_ORIENTATION=+